MAVPPGWPRFGPMTREHVAWWGADAAGCRSASGIAPSHWSGSRAVPARNAALMRRCSANRRPAAMSSVIPSPGPLGSSRWAALYGTAPSKLALRSGFGPTSYSRSGGTALDRRADRTGGRPGSAAPPQAPPPHPIRAARSASAPRHRARRWCEPPRSRRATWVRLHHRYQPPIEWETWFRPPHAVAVLPTRRLEDARTSPQVSPGRLPAAGA